MRCAPRRAVTVRFPSARRSREPRRSLPALRAAGPPRRRRAPADPHTHRARRGPVARAGPPRACGRLRGMDERSETVSGGRHSSETNRWGTPGDVVERARRCTGGIDLDPCTEPALESTVRAERSYSLVARGEDGLVLPWHGRVFCNPPGGLVRKFWRRMLS